MLVSDGDRFGRPMPALGLAVQKVPNGSRDRLWGHSVLASSACFWPGRQ